MDCTECGDNMGGSTKVEYTDGTTEVIPLCDTCRQEFDKAELVDEVKAEPGED